MVVVAGFVVVVSVVEVDFGIVLVLAGLLVVPAVVVVAAPPLELPRVGLADAVILELLCATELDTPEMRVGPGTI